MSAESPVVIQETTNYNLAQILRNALEGAGIKCEVVGESQGAFPGVCFLQITVREEDAERARELIAEHHHGEPLAPQRFGKASRRSHSTRPQARTGRAARKVLRNRSNLPPFHQAQQVRVPSKKRKEGE